MTIAANQDNSMPDHFHVGPSRAKEIILTCRHYRAKELLCLGLLNQVVVNEALAPTVAALADSLVKKKPNAVMVFRAEDIARQTPDALPDLLWGRGLSR